MSKKTPIMEEHPEHLEKLTVPIKQKNAFANRKNKSALQFNQFINRSTGTQYRRQIKLPGLKRISPFVMLAVFIFLFFPYLFFTGSIKNPWLYFIFPFILINALLIDFALWNYFKKKKILKIWIIELPITISILFLLL